MADKGFQGKVVVVTGGASGIGEAVCRRFARDGALIGIIDLDGSRADRLAAELMESGTGALSLAADVSCRETCQAAVRKVIDRFGGIDILVNNAGITQRGAFVHTDVAVFQKVMAVNFFGALYTTKAALPSLLERRGLIIVMESIAGIAPLYGRSGYSASKHALHGLFTSLRAEVGREVHVLNVCPGFTSTSLQERALGEDGRVTGHPQSTVGKPDTPDRVAERIYRAAGKHRPLLVLTPTGKLTYWMSRLAPVIFERLMARKLKAELVRPQPPASRP